MSIELIHIMMWYYDVVIMMIIMRVSETHSGQVAQSTHALQIFMYSTNPSHKSAWERG